MFKPQCLVKYWRFLLVRDRNKTSAQVLQGFMCRDTTLLRLFLDLHEAANLGPISLDLSDYYGEDIISLSGRQNTGLETG